jgi:hypothetical protein
VRATIFSLCSKMAHAQEQRDKVTFVLKKIIIYGIFFIEFWNAI